jgi:hypothetical protein
MANQSVAEMKPNHPLQQTRKKPRAAEWERYAAETGES